MKSEVAVAMAAILATTASARETTMSAGTGRHAKRQVPQEHSHRQFILGAKAALDLNNRFNIVDPVFGLLGNGAAAEGAGEIVNLDCLQQIIADEAFNNARAIDDLDGMISALIYRALEKNTLTVGEQSVPCNEIALNPQIQALQQHQDPASDNADEINAAIELELARQLASVGADPLLALLSATFEAGEIGDPTGAGNTCNDEEDDLGCIFTENLIRPVVSADEIMAAVQDITDGSDVAAVSDVMAAEIEAAAAAAESVSGASAASSEAETEAEVADVEVSAVGANIQAFAGELGGPAPEVIQSDNERPFEVNGATFLEAGAALIRSCDVQNNACFNAVNSGQLDASTTDCLTQQSDCIAQANAQARRVRRGIRIHRRQNNIQSFAGNLGGAAPPVIQNDNNDRPFEVNGATFLQAAAALNRSCAVQNNACFNAVNSGQIDADGADCQAQEQACLANAGAVVRRV